LSGYTIFRFRQPGPVDSEGTAAFDASTASSVALPYDNTNGLRTGVALANESSSAATITATLRDQNGAQLATTQLSLPAFGHSSFFVDELFAASRNQLGVIQFQSAGALSAVGLRFSPAGTFTSIPLIGGF
jgi:hypothetical protein